MRPQPSQPPIRPKVSTMPRPKTEAAAYLDIYKLVTERKRLEQELELINQRRDRLIQRLEVLDQQTHALEDTAHQIRSNTVQPDCHPASCDPMALKKDFNTFYFEY